jgi:hypothetical protein
VTQITPGQKNSGRSSLGKPKSSKPFTRLLGVSNIPDGSLLTDFKAPLKLLRGFFPPISPPRR